MDYSVPAEAPDILSVRRQLTLQSIIEVKLEIEERARLGQETICALDELVGNVHSSLRRMAFRAHTVEMQSIYAQLQNQLLATERQAAQEPIETWRDLVQLKRELRELWKEYLALPQ